MFKEYQFEQRNIINSALDNRITLIMTDLLFLRGNAQGQSYSDNLETNSPDEEFKVFCCGGQFHFIPEGYVLPHCSPKRLWILWIFGDSLHKIRSFRYLSGKSFTSYPSFQRRNFSERAIKGFLILDSLMLNLYFSKH